MAQTGVVECKECGEQETYKDAQCPNDVSIQTGYIMEKAGEWNCPECQFAQKCADAAYRAWDYIAEDCFVDEYGNHDGSIIYTRKEVVEMATDANRMVTCGGLTIEEERKFFKLPKADQEKIMMKSFPSNIWGY